MKKVILTLLVALVFLENSRANDNMGSIYMATDGIKTYMPTDGIKIVITVEIGAPITCFIKFAVCRVTFGSGNLAGTVELLNASDDKFAGGGGGGGGARSWLLSIPRENFAKYYPEYLSRLDGQNTVTFEASYTMPPDVKKAMGATKDLVIQGNVAYPLKYENGVFTITFPQ